MKEHQTDVLSCCRKKFLKNRKCYIIIMMNSMEIAIIIEDFINYCTFTKGLSGKT